MLYISIFCAALKKIVLSLNCREKKIATDVEKNCDTRLFGRKHNQKYARDNWFLCILHIIRQFESVDTEQSKRIENVSVESRQNAHAHIAHTEMIGMHISHPFFGLALPQIRFNSLFLGLASGLRQSTEEIAVYSLKCVAISANAICTILPVVRRTLLLSLFPIRVSHMLSICCQVISDERLRD